MEMLEMVILELSREDGAGVEGQHGGLPGGKDLVFPDAGDGKEFRREVEQAHDPGLTGRSVVESDFLDIGEVESGSVAVAGPDDERAHLGGCRLCGKTEGAHQSYQCEEYLTHGYIFIC